MAGDYTRCLLPATKAGNYTHDVYGRGLHTVSMAGD